MFIFYAKFIGVSYECCFVYGEYDSVLVYIGGVKKLFCNFYRAEVL